MLNFVIFAIITIFVMAISLLVGFLITKNTYIREFVIILIKIAEKYVSIDGNTKMTFVVKIVYSIYSMVYKVLKLSVPSEDSIKDYCQKVFNQIQEEVNVIKTKATAKDTANKVEKEIQEITKEKETNEKV